MDRPIIRATWQAAVLSAISNLLGQALTCYQSNKPCALNTIDLFHFVLFAVLSTPPNFLWQTWLESRFPAYPTKTDDHTKRRDYDPKKPKDNPPPTQDNKPTPLSLLNTFAKFALDQTLGATVNTLLFIGGIALLRGKPSHAIVRDCRQQFWPLMFAGQKLWPAVSLVSFLVVPVELRTTFGGVVGLFWGIYLSLISSSDRTV